MKESHKDMPEIPVAKAVTVYRPKSDIETLTHEAMLTGEDIVPGLTCPVENLFA